MTDISKKARKAWDKADDKAHELKGRAKQKIDDMKAGAQEKEHEQNARPRASGDW